MGRFRLCGHAGVAPFIAFAPKSLDEVSRRAELVRWRDHLTNVIAASKLGHVGIDD